MKKTAWKSDQANRRYTALKSDVLNKNQANVADILKVRSSKFNRIYVSVYLSSSYFSAFRDLILSTIQVIAYGNAMCVRILRVYTTAVYISS